MHLSSYMLRLSGLSLSFVLALIVFTSESFVSNTETRAEGYHSGATIKGVRVKAPSALIKRVTTSRSGVRLGKVKRHYQKPYYNRVEKRKRQIAHHNIRVQENNRLRRLKASTRRTGPNGRFLTQKERVEILNNNVVESEFVSTSQGIDVLATSNCPSKHDCGYRLYEDGTGPRIITPGVYLNNNLPSYDGLNGPKIITLD